MLQPKREKYRKQYKGRLRGTAQRGVNVNFGEFGMKSIESGMITGKQIEAARRVIVRKVKKGGKLWIRVFPDKPVTKKPLEVRQGKGKGPVEFWVFPVQPGKILFEVEGISQAVAEEVFAHASAKLPIKCICVRRTLM